MHRTRVARVAAVALAAAAFTAFAPAVPAIADPTVRAAEKCPGVSTVGRYCGYHPGTQWAELGSQGNHVKEIQALINETTRYGEPGGTKLVVDGIYGAKTKSAVTWFQWYYGSEAISDGIVGPQTWEMLRYGKR